MKIFSTSLVAVTASLLITNSAQAEKLTGTVSIDGSSTVFPLTEAVAEEFRKVQPKIRVTVGVSGTGGGFKKFAAGNISINDASRPIKQREIDLAKKSNVEYLELPVALDALSVVTSKDNDFITSITKEELKNIWKYQPGITKWSDINPKYPAEKIKLYGPGADSGTFDYFAETILGKKAQVNANFTASEDDNVLVSGIRGSKFALGYFGYAYYLENKNSLKALAIDFGKGAIAPTEESLADGTYPLSRPLFIYVNKDHLKRPEVAAFVKYYMKNAPALAKEIGYEPLTKASQIQATSRLNNALGKL